MRRAALLASSVLVLALPAHAAGIAVALDEVRTITFAKPVATVYIGNPAIADISMIDARHAFIQGKSYGHTNIVALNKDGAQVSNTHVSVMGTDSASVTLDRGTQRTTYTCSAHHCEIAPQPGDGKDAFEQLNTQLAAHQDAARKAATSGQ